MTTPPGATTETIRAFVAIALSESIRDALTGVQQQLRQTGARVRWVEPDRMHLTLLFLGDLPTAKVPDVAAAMDSVTAETPVFALTLTGGGAFGPKRSPRVIWSDIRDQDGALQRLYERLLTSMKAADVTFDDRPFKPHLTLGRVRARQRLDRLLGVLADMAWPTGPSMTVREILLLQSHLRPEGAMYQTVHTASLANA